MTIASPSIRGIYPAMLTMFTNTGDLDPEATQQHANWLIDQGVHGLVVTGTSGEFIALTLEERRHVIAAVHAVASDRVPVYACTSVYSDRHTLELTEYAEKTGVDGIVILPPIYQKPPKPAIVDHFRAVRRSTSLPMMFYNNPAYAGTVELTPWDIAELVDEGVFQSIKHTYASNAGIHDLLYLCPASFRVFHGGFQTALEGLAAGAHGWISGFLNAMPAQAIALYEALCIQRDLKRGQEIWKTMIPFTHLFFAPTGLASQANDLEIWRTFLDLSGHHGGYSRPPFYPLTPGQRQQVEQLMKKQNLL